MKKTIMTLLAASFAVCSYGAIVTWGSGSIVNAAGAAAKATVTAKLFVITAEDYTSLSKYATNGKTLSDQVYAKYGTATADVTKNSAKSIANLSDPSSYSSGKTAYSAILYSYTDGGKEMYMGNIGQYTFDAEVDFTVANMSALIGGAETGTIATAWSSGGGSSVPEPTSGLLILFGVCGLALRRRRV